MARGQGSSAVHHADAARAAAATLGSVRHTVKTEVVMAAALCCVGDLDGSRRVADAALEVTEQHGMVPLRWALASLLAGIGSGVRSEVEVASIRDGSADTVRSRAACGPSAETGALHPESYCLAEPSPPVSVRYVTLERSPTMTISGERLDDVVAEAVAGNRDALRGCWRPFVPSSSGTSGRGWGRLSEVASQLMTSRRRCAWPP